MTQSAASLSHVVIHLMKGVLYQDKHIELWNSLLNLQSAIREYTGVIGLDLYIDEAEGFAFLRQCEVAEDDKDNAHLPRLVQRRPLSYFVSLLCVLLRKKYVENDTAGGDSRVILTHQQILDMMLVFLPDRANEIKTKEQIESCIHKMIEFGFLRKLTNDTTYEVQRIIKALIDASWLSNIDNKLREYQEHGQYIAV